MPALPRRICLPDPIRRALTIVVVVACFVVFLRTRGDLAAVTAAASAAIAGIDLVRRLRCTATGPAPDAGSFG